MTLKICFPNNHYGFQNPQNLMPISKKLTQKSLHKESQRAEKFCTQYKKGEKVQNFYLHFYANTFVGTGTLYVQNPFPRKLSRCIDFCIVFCVIYSLHLFPVTSRHRVYWCKVQICPKRIQIQTRPGNLELKLAHGFFDIEILINILYIEKAAVQLN